MHTSNAHAPIEKAHAVNFIGETSKGRNAPWQAIRQKALA